MASARTQQDAQDNKPARERKFACQYDGCTKTYSNKTDLEDHVYGQDHENIKLCCLFCQKEVVWSKNTRRRHLGNCERAPHNEGDAVQTRKGHKPCPSCGRTCRSDNLTRHLRTCNGNPRTRAPRRKRRPTADEERSQTKQDPALYIANFQESSLATHSYGLSSSEYTSAEELGLSGAFSRQNSFGSAAEHSSPEDPVGPMPQVGYEPVGDAFMSAPDLQGLYSMDYSAMGTTSSLQPDHRPHQWLDPATTSGSEPPMSFTSMLVEDLIDWDGDQKEAAESTVIPTPGP